MTDAPFAGAAAQALADRVLRRLPEAARQRLVDDHRRLARSASSVRVNSRPASSGMRSVWK